MLSNLMDVQPAADQVPIGAPVEIVYDDVNESITLPRFRLVGS
jgi:hypothetical protein